MNLELTSLLHVVQYLSESIPSALLQQRAAAITELQGLVTSIDVAQSLRLAALLLQQQRCPIQDLSARSRSRSVKRG